MHSIRTRITALSLAALLVGILAVGGIGAAFIRSQGARDADAELRLACDNRRKILDKYLLSLEQSVDMAAHYAAESLRGVDLAAFGVEGATGLSGHLAAGAVDKVTKPRLNAFLKAHSEKVEALLNSVAKYTSGVLTYYYRLNPELSDTQRGFLYSRMNNSSFSPAGLVDIFAYPPDDTGHVGWYYPAVESGRPAWISPYSNVALGLDVASYVSPVYCGDTFIGLVGMDISRFTLISQIETIAIYQTGYACLANANGTVYYHPVAVSGTDISELSPEVSRALNSLEADDDRVFLVNYTYEGVAKKAACAALENGLRLVIVAPLREINASWQRVMQLMILVAAVVMAVFGVISYSTLKRVTDPLSRLAEASRRLEAGDYGVKLDTGAEDEVGILTRSFQSLVDHLNVYITDLNSKAYKDAMTGVKNKAAFETCCEELNRTIADGGAEHPPEFALVMMDCNALKEINDHYGHEKGDLYLQAACHMICSTFVHSPVFRIGGDEFVALLQNSDYVRRDALVRTFELRYKAYNQGVKNPWERVGLAIGMAVYDPRKDADVESVFRRADERMYQQKKASKLGRE